MRSGLPAQLETEVRQLAIADRCSGVPGLSPDSQDVRFLAGDGASQDTQVLLAAVQKDSKASEAGADSRPRTCWLRAGDEPFS